MVDEVVLDDAVRRLQDQPARTVAPEVAPLHAESVARVPPVGDEIADGNVHVAVKDESERARTGLREAWPEPLRLQVLQFLRRAPFSRSHGRGGNVWQHATVVCEYLQGVALRDARGDVVGQQPERPPLRLDDDGVLAADVHAVVAVVERGAADDLRANDRAPAHERIVVSAPKTPQPPLLDVRLRRPRNEAAAPIDRPLGKHVVESRSVRSRIDRYVL